MKLASLNNARRDGELAVVSRDLRRCASVADIAPTLQAALDDWQQAAPRLAERAAALAQERLPGSREFLPAQARSPLPRAYQWADGSAYVTHVELVRKARGAELPESFWSDPLIYQGGSDILLDPHGEIPAASEEHGIDFEAEIAVITDEVPMGIDPLHARGLVRLVMLVNDVSLRNLIPGELAKGFGFFQSKPSSAFSPVAVTPDELGDAWREGKLHLPLISTLNGEEFGRPNAGIDMTFDFGQLIAHAAKTRALCAGTIIGSGTVSNQDRSTGSSCIAERRMLETLEHGAPRTAFMRFGDTIRIEMLDTRGDSIFGAIENRVVEYQGPADT
jgi:fumarylacetoacetate (FAA) hydrolase